MRTKRIHYPIDKNKIQEAIDLYVDFAENGLEESWSKFYDVCQTICKGPAWAVLTSMFQPMRWAKTLTVDNVYHAILVMGVNTVVEEYDD